MINGLSVLGLITARGGSKGIPRKNITPVGGRPLIDWTIQAGLAAQTIDRLILSSDDDEIIAVARACGCDVPFRRPAELATDTCDSMSVVRHALGEVPGFDLVVLLQPTSPLRTAEDIDNAVAVALTSPRHTTISVHAVEKSAYLMYRQTDEGHLADVIDLGMPIGRRQDLPPLYAQNGAIYVAETAHIVAGGGFMTTGTRPYIMDRERSFDVDDPSDLIIVDAFLRTPRP